MDRFSRLETLFHAAAALGPQEREAFLRSQEKDDPALLEEVRRLLRAEAGAEPRMAAMSGSLALPAGLAQFGAYRVVRLLGRGGMGAVYLAERADGEYAQLVALKVLSPHMAGEAFVARFRTERQLLAQMNHPNIVRLLDGGVSATGEPYLVTEYIDGEPLDAYADRMRLRVEPRVRLLVEVCEAVSYAHRNLVIHRDLKPGNVLVNGSGEVKLLDFGTAKLLPAEGRVAETTLPLLTPRYASPEQLRGAGLTTATDVYSLGLMLYELLAGHRAFELPNDIARELARATDDLPVVALGARATEEGAAARGVSLGRLQEELKGDLSYIAAKAVAYSLGERYQSVAELRDDLRAYLEFRPVKARPVTAIYRARKFIHRHRYMAAAGVAFVVVGAAGVVATVGARNLAEARFAEVRSLARYQVFDLYDQAELIPGTLRMRAQMAERSLAYLDGLARQKNLDVELAVEVARGYRRLGDARGNFAKATLGNPEVAIRIYRKGLELVTPFSLKDDAAKRARRELEVSAAIAGVVSNLGGEMAPQLMRLTAEMEAAVEAAPGDAETRLLLGRACTTLLSTGEGRGLAKQLVEEYGRKARKLLEEGVSRGGPLEAEMKMALVELYRVRSAAVVDVRPAEARALVAKGLEVLGRMPGEWQPGSMTRKARASFLMVEAAAMRAEGNTAGALGAIEAPLAIIRELAREPEDLQAAANLALLLENRSLMRWDAGDYQGYVADLSEAAPLGERLATAVGGRRFRLMYLSLLRGLAYGHDKLGTAGKLEAARRAYVELKKAAGDESLGYKPKADLADLLLNVGLDGKARPEEALEYAEASVKQDPGAMNAWESLAEANRQLGHYQEALQAIDRAMATIGTPKEGEAPTRFYLDLKRKQRQILQEAAARKPGP